ncbi:hypothetical protein Taro_031405 [Colocasia esculenta]|uniref:Uncharacterized protein n=1 Tax=Colocasia esculenta TaxID=4460 RepID=A0A843VNT9_COLES|nr:hypothetical protein [Colocasia esculenta]
MEMAEVCLHPQADEVTGLRREVDELRSQLGTKWQNILVLRANMRGLERALSLVGRSRMSANRSCAPSGSTGHYLTGCSRRRRNEEEGRRHEGAAKGSTTGPREMAPPPSHPPEGELKGDGDGNTLQGEQHGSNAPSPRVERTIKMEGLEGIFGNN